MQPLSTSKTNRAPLRLFLLTSCLLGAMGLASCASQPKAVTLTIPASLRADCKGPAGEDRVQTMGDLAAFSLRQEAAILDCNTKRREVVRLADEFNAAVKPKRRVWPF